MDGSDLPETITFEWMKSREFCERFTIDADLFPIGHPIKIDGKDYLCAVQGGQLKGFVKCDKLQSRTFKKSGSDYSTIDPSWHLQMIEVATNAQGHGIARGLLNKLFADAQAAQCPIHTDGFTADGQKYLLRIIDQKIQQYGKDAHFNIPWA